MPRSCIRTASTTARLLDQVDPFGDPRVAGGGHQGLVPRHAEAGVAAVRGDQDAVAAGLLCRVDRRPATVAAVPATIPVASAVPVAVTGPGGDVAPALLLDAHHG